jgi:hypothetical protein
MKLGRKHWGAIGIATVLIVVMAPSDNDRTDNKAARSGSRIVGEPENSSGQRTNDAGHVELYRLAKLELRHKDAKKVGDAFNTNSWEAPPPPIHPIQPVAPTPPPVIVPTAPPLPFTYLGRYGDSASRTVILSKGDRVYTVAVGEVIENTYRVEKLTTGTINLTYLPLNIEQHLSTGEAL